MISGRECIFILLILISTTAHIINGFDCYYCSQCLNQQRGVRIAARTEDWCYKIVWRSGFRNQQVVSRGASTDCRQDVFNDQSMSIPGIFSGTARYCCRSHLCNSGFINKKYPFLYSILFSLLFILL